MSRFPRARNLKLMRLDDGLVIGALGKVMDTPPAFVDLFEVREGAASLNAINGWHAAIRFWRALQVGTAPDLVVADVLFEADSTSPLSIVQPFETSQRPIPTGLSHLKAFAAFARATGRPIGIAIHTRNPFLWRRAWEHGHPMGALAAQEIGELAALLGEQLGPNGQDGSSVAQSVEKCWNWLANTVATDFNPVIPLVLENYRKRLIEGASLVSRPLAVMLPGTWARLAGWLDEQRQNPQPIGRDISLDLIFADGQRDSIRLASVFADVRNIAEVVFPAECFDLSTGGSEPPWQVRNLSPNVGGLVRALGELSAVVRQARAAVDHFPRSLTEGGSDKAASPVIPFNLNEAVGRVPGRDIIAGFAVLFQIARWEHERVLVWRDGLSCPGWNLRLVRLTGTGGETLAGTLRLLLRRMRMHTEDFFIGDALGSDDDGGLFQERDAETAWLQFHLNLLIAAGYVHSVNDMDPEMAEYGRMLRCVGNAPLNNADLPAPNRLPDGFPPFREDVKGFLRDSLGFGSKFGPGTSNNDNGVDIRLAKAFCGGDEPSAGRNFLDTLLEGRGPGWICEVVMEYVEGELGWLERRTWPFWLRTM